MARTGQSKGLEAYTHEQVKELLELIQRLDLQEVEMESGDFRLHVVGRNAAPAPAIGAHYHHQVTEAPVMPSSGEVPLPPPMAAPAPPAADADDTSKYTKVTSPMIGTFYRAPAPDAPSFVEVGDHVDDNTVLCIIEAMKLMNEIKAETRGIVRKILVENGQPVEYGQPMFLVEPL